VKRIKKKDIFCKSVIASILVLSVLPSMASADTISTVVPDGPDTGYTVFETFNKSKLGPNPIDGPTDEGHLMEAYVPGVGNVFQIHANQFGDYDGGNLDRQRIELKGHKSSNADVKGNLGEILTYNWQFRVMSGFQMPPAGAFNHIFQLKAQDGDDGAPILTFTVADDQLLFRHTATGATMDDVEVLAATDWSRVLDHWLDATITVENAEAGKVEMVLKDAATGQTLMSYSGIKDNWRLDASINRPKWGIYRKIFSGIEEANVQYTHFEITKHNVDNGIVHQVNLNGNTHVEAEDYYSKTGYFRQAYDSTGAHSNDAYMQVPEGWAYDSPSNIVTYKLNVSNPTPQAYLHIYGNAPDASSNQLNVNIGSIEGTGTDMPIQLSTSGWGWSSIPVSLLSGPQFVTLMTAGDGMKVDKMAVTSSAEPPASFMVPKLKNLTLNGQTLDGFSPNVKSYTVNLPFGTTTAPQVVGTFLNPSTGLEEQIIPTPLNSLSGTVALQVTNPLEPILSTTYTIHFNGMEVEGSPTPMMIYPVASVTGPGNVKNMTDNVITSLWDNKPSDNNANNTVFSSVYFDLNEIQPLNRIYVGFSPTGNNVSFKFDVELSTDNQNWTKVLNGQWSNGLTTQLQPFTFPETAARYVRYNGYAGKKNNGSGSLEKYNKVTEIKFAGDTQLNAESSSYSLNLNESHQTVVSITYANQPLNPIPVTINSAFKSWDQSIATVTSGGLITGISTGKTVVEATYGNHTKFLEITVGDAQDTSVPVWPSGHASQAVDTYPNKAFITWTAAIDHNGGIAGYRIYSVNGETYTLLKEVDNVLYTTLEGLSSDTTYSLALKAFDYDGNESEYGALIKKAFTTPLDTQAPMWVNASLVESEVTTTGAKMTWTTAIDNVGVAGYRLYAVTDNVYSDILSSSTTQYEVTGLSPNTAYTYIVQALDEAGNWSEGLQAMFRTNEEDHGSGNENGNGNDNGNEDGNDNDNGNGKDNGNGNNSNVDENKNSNDNGNSPKNISLDLTKDAIVTTTPAADGRNVTIVSVDADKLKQAMSGSNVNRTVEIKVDTQAPIVRVELPGQALQNAATNAIIQIEVKGTTYFLQVGLFKDIPKDALIEVSIADVSRERHESVTNAVNDANAQQLLNTPIEFSIVINGQELSDFNGIYVDRTVSLGQSVDPNKVTAVWIDEENQVHFIPSVVATTNHSAEVTIRSPHNSVYSVVRSDQSFVDLSGHWAKSDVEMLANKLIVKGQSEELFAPDSHITRAEFAALLVRSLGLIEEKSASFTDVPASSWFAGVVGTAKKYGLLDGYEDSSFQPNSSITREQIAVMVDRALKLVGKEAIVEPDNLNAFADHSDIAVWSQVAVSKLVSASIIQGMTENSFEPQMSATRAQAAAILKRTLQILDFIN
jgi:hypothetical protein